MGEIVRAFTREMIGPGKYASLRCYSSMEGILQLDDMPCNLLGSGYELATVAPPPGTPSPSIGFKKRVVGEVK